MTFLKHFYRVFIITAYLTEKNDVSRTGQLHVNQTVCTETKSYRRHLNPTISFQAVS